MKKEVSIWIFLIFSIVLLVSFINATNDLNMSVDNAGYQCLSDKIDDCSSLSLEENIFSLLSMKKCKTEVTDASSNDECWPSSSCSIKTTSQAVLALDKSGADTSDAENWLLSQNDTTSDELQWYLQIESSNPVQCSITYEGGSGSITTDVEFDIDRRLVSDPSSSGNCFDGNVGDYWPEVKSSCFGKELTISCNESFSTSLLYKKPDSSTIHVLSETSSSVGEGETTETVSSSCFERNGMCNYEGTLWASLVLNSLGYNVESYLPYLITMRTDYEDTLFPSTFLWHLTGDEMFYSEIMGKQITMSGDSYWQQTREGKYFDTALALYSLMYDDSSAKDNSVLWLEDSQGADGCWNNGNLRDTAFVLFSVWPRGYFDDGTSGGGTTLDCEASGNFCMSRYSCEIEAQGNVLEDYICGGTYVCCSNELVLSSCLDLEGSICNDNEICKGGQVLESADTIDSGKCCISGTCTSTTSSGNEATCESNGGICRPYGCNSDEEESYTETCDYGESCCFASTSGGSGNGSGESSSTTKTIFLILGILIVLAVLGIVFKDNLRKFLFRFKGGNKSSSKRGPRYPPAPLMSSPRPLPVRRRAPSHPRRGGEMDDVLKKLKEMGK